MTYRRGEFDAWAHGTRVDADGIKAKCIYCSKIVSGITRLKQHLARIRGDVTACPTVPDTVRHKILKYLEEHPYPRRVVNPHKNHQNIGEGSSVGGQSSHEQTNKNAQTQEGGSHHNFELTHHQIIVDLDPEDNTDIGVTMKAKREEIEQMVTKKINERKMKNGHIDCSSTAAPAHQTLIWAAAAEESKSKETLVQEANTAKKNLLLIKKKYKGYRNKVRAEEEQFRKILETTNQQLQEKIEEVEVKNRELGTLKAALEAKEKKLERFHAALQAKQRELAAKENETERLRTGTVAAQAEWYMQGRNEIIIKAKEVGLNHKLLLPDPADDPTE